MGICINLGSRTSVETGLKVLKALQNVGLRGRDVTVDLSKMENTNKEEDE